MAAYLTINTLAEISCTLIALFCLTREHSPLWRGLGIYLFLVCLVELSGIYLRNTGRHNYGLYNAILPLECLTMSLLFREFYRPYIRTPLLFSGWMALFIMVYSAELYTSRMMTFCYRTAALISVVFVIASLYFYLLILKDTRFIKLATYPPFWIVNGILFFYFGSTVSNVFFDYLAQDHKIQLSSSIRYITFNILNVLLYTCWSYAFICRYRQKN